MSRFTDELLLELDRQFGGREAVRMAVAAGYTPVQIFATWTQLSPMWGMPPSLRTIQRWAASETDRLGAEQAGGGMSND